MLTTDILSWKKLSERQQKPVHLILFITDHCNAKCGTCFYWQNLNQGEALQPEHIQKISEAMGELVWLDLSGGEPFLRKDIDQICHRFVDYNQAKFINIPTNALQTDVIRKSVEGILANPNKFRLNIAISIDGIGENHDRIRGVPGNYKRALATMEALREIRTRDKRLSLSVVSTVMSSNIEDIKRLLNLGVTSNGIWTITRSTSCAVNGWILRSRRPRLSNTPKSPNSSCTSAAAIFTAAGEASAVGLPPSAASC